jgi:hypothetical protein
LVVANADTVGVVTVQVAQDPVPEVTVLLIDWVEPKLDSEVTVKVTLALLFAPAVTVWVQLWPAAYPELQVHPSVPALVELYAVPVGIVSVNRVDPDVPPLLVTVSVYTIG